MNIRHWIADNIGYRFSGCFYAKTHDHIFNFIETKIPKEFLGKSISDLGCGDGLNTLRIEKIFKAKNIVGYERNSYLIERVERKGLKVKRSNLNSNFPKGELASFTFSLHHLDDKEKSLRKARDNFNYIFLCEPCNDLYHRLLDVGRPLIKKDWIKLFDKVLGRYELHQYKNNLIVFHKKSRFKVG